MHMKTTFFILLVVHALIHLLGFIKGFGINNVSVLTLPISKSTGLLWLTATILLLLYGLMYITGYKIAWLIGLIAVLVSQVLIVLFWSDVKFGTIPNIIALLVVIVSLGQHRFQKQVQEETTKLVNESKNQHEKIITEKDLEDLPVAVKKWMMQSGIVGKPSIFLVKITQKAELRMKPDQKKWMQAEAVQYTSTDVPSFIWSVKVHMNPLLHFLGRDKFEDGKGEMRIRLNALFTIVDEKGERLDEGTLQRFLGEMVWFPSMALSPYISWEDADDLTATATMTYMGTTGSGTFHFDETGNFIRFTAMRFMGNAEDAKRHLWILDVEEHKSFEGITIPSRMTASWALNEETWTWLKLEIIGMQYNENALSEKIKS